MKARPFRCPNLHAHLRHSPVTTPSSTPWKSGRRSHKRQQRVSGWEFRRCLVRLLGRDGDRCSYGNDKETCQIKTVYKSGA